MDRMGFTSSHMPQLILPLCPTIVNHINPLQLFTFEFPRVNRKYIATLTLTLLTAEYNVYFCFHLNNHQPQVFQRLTGMSYLIFRHDDVPWCNLRNLKIKQSALYSYIPLTENKGGVINIFV